MAMEKQIRMVVYAVYRLKLAPSQKGSLWKWDGVTYYIVGCFGADEELRSDQVSHAVSDKDESRGCGLLGEPSRVARKQGQHQREDRGNRSDHPETRQASQSLVRWQQLDHETSRNCHEVDEDNRSKTGLADSGGDEGGDDDGE
jgi:hypothetical protein